MKGHAMSRTRPWTLATALACVLAICAAVVPAATSSARADDVKAGGRAAVTLSLDGAVVIGASVSAGFGCLMPVDVTPPDAPKDAERVTTMGTVRLTDMLAAATVDPAKKPRSWATGRFFQDPERFGEETLKKAIEAKPTMVFAVDYLFWHAYGWTLDEGSRTEKFERGLKRLERLGADIPIVVGDLPDMRHATLMLQPEMVPSRETLGRLNTRLAEWAKGRTNVVIVPLSGFVKSALSGEPVTMAGRTWTQDEVQTWLQGDGLHATPAGTAALAVDVLWRMREAKMLPEGAVYPNDPKTLLDRVKPMVPTKKK
jgi:hypothetical protein